MDTPETKPATKLVRVPGAPVLKKPDISQLRRTLPPPLATFEKPEISPFSNPPVAVFPKPEIKPCEMPPLDVFPKPEMVCPVLPMPPKPCSRSPSSKSPC